MDSVMYRFLLIWAMAVAAIAAAPSGEELFLQGDDLSRGGKAAEAIKAFDACAEASPLLRPYALIRAASARAAGGDKAGAVDALTRLLEKETPGPWTRLAQVRLASLLVDAGDRAGGRLLYEHAVNLQPLPWFMEESAWAAADNLTAAPDTASSAFPFLSTVAQKSVYINPRKRAARALVSFPDEKAQAMGIATMMRSGMMDDARKWLADHPISFKLPEGGEMPSSIVDALLAAFPDPTPETAARIDLLTRTNQDNPWMKVWLTFTLRSAAARKVYGVAELCGNVFMAHYADDPEGGDAAYWLAGHYRGTKQAEKARIWYQRFLDKYPGHPKAADALMALGDMALEEKRWGDALGFYNEFMHLFPQHRAAAEVLLDCADINAHTGNREEEKRYLTKAAERGPGPYAAHRAAARLTSDGAKLPGARDLSVVPGKKILAAMTTGIQPAQWLADTDTTDEGLKRLRFFGAHGLEEGEWEAVECILRAPAGDARKKWYGAIADAGYMHTLLQFVSLEGFGVEKGEWTPARRRLEYPLAYWPQVTAIAKEVGVDPFLLLAISRQESTFRAGIVSNAGATGLMQLMPGTAQWLAKKKGAVPQNHADHLENPEYSLRMGAVYIKQMLDRSGDNLIYALASYNAGPGNCDKWTKGDIQDMDRFIESIPFDETRLYVKKVLGNYAAYHSLYRIP